MTAPPSAPLRRSTRTRLAAAVRVHTEKHIAAAKQGTYIARIVALNPLQAELGTSGLSLTEDNLLVSQWVRRYDYDFGLRVGDTLVVTQMTNDEFIAHDVVSSNKIEAGLDHPNAIAVSLTSRNGHINHKIPVLNDAGIVIGYSLVYTSPSGDGAPS